jgi:hypothetical protein
MKRDFEGLYEIQKKAERKSDIENTFIFIVACILIGVIIYITS